MTRSFTVALCILALGVSCARPRPQPLIAPPPPAVRPVTELRGVWVSDTPRLDWDSASANLQRAGFNTMYVNFASAGAAFYPGNIGRGLQLAHQRGLAVHAKLIVLFMFKTTPEFQRRLIATDRVMRGADGRPVLQSGFAWLCPSQPANRAMMADTVTEILQRYRVDGLQFDYIRYFEEPACFCANCRRDFERAVGRHFRRWPADVLEGPTVVRYNQWRQQLITDWVRELSSVARRMRPGMPISAAVFADLDRAREEKAQDWKLWLERGYVDYVCTMTYTTDAREFELQVRKQQVWAPRRNQVIVGIGSWKFDRMSQLQARIDTSRRLGAPGFVLFSYDDAAARDFLPNLVAQK
jgi:uncharacterized lipoprotein YddW (UPF0748 family)